MGVWNRYRLKTSRNRFDTFTKVPQRRWDLLRLCVRGHLPTTSDCPTVVHPTRSGTSRSCVPRLNTHPNRTKEIVYG